MAMLHVGTSFERKELFGQLPLQVDGFKDIHESLEATTAQGEIETLTAGVQSRSCQEVSVKLMHQVHQLHSSIHIHYTIYIHNRFVLC